jgi:hypothetical protein
MKCCGKPVRSDISTTLKPRFAVSFLNGFGDTALQVVLRDIQK